MLMLFRTSALRLGVHLTVADPPPHVRAAIEALRAGQLLAAAPSEDGRVPMRAADGRRARALQQHCLRPSTATRRQRRTR